MLFFRTLKLFLTFEIGIWLYFPKIRPKWGRIDKMLKSACSRTYLISVMEEESSIFLKCLQSPICVPIHSVCGCMCVHTCVCPLVSMYITVKKRRGIQWAVSHSSGNGTQIYIPSCWLLKFQANFCRTDRSGVIDGGCLHLFIGGKSLKATNHWFKFH